MRELPGSLPGAFRGVSLWALAGAAVAGLLLLGACQQEQADEGYDAIVIGGGLMGSSAAWQLAKAGQRVLLLEKQAAEYTEGSSLGEARIARSLGGTGDVWSYLHNRTVAEVEELIGFLNGHEPGHSMSDIYATSPVSYVRHHSQAAWIDRIRHNQVDRYEYASAPEEADALFNLKMPPDTIMWREYKAHSGTINPQALIAYLHKALALLRGSVQYHNRVDELSRDGDRYRLLVTNTQTGESRRLSAGKVVSAAGPYTSRLLERTAPYFNSLINPQRVFLAFFAIQPDVYQSWAEADKQRFRDLYPAINSTDPTPEGSFFTMLEGQTSEGSPIIKIGGHFQRSDISDLDAVWQKELADAEIQWSRESTARHLSLLDLGIGEEDLNYVSGYSCVYSLTETEFPYVTPVRNDLGEPDPNLVVIAGLSGVGAKGALAYGLIAANLLLGQDDPDPMYQKAQAAFGYERLVADLSP
ncbi:MAG: FAD-dependent oxidoreductase [Gammaproteobacteria bacterium]|nr:FAD-dependent oxidoreductase [Gammaproteobacteria bacterium]